MTAPYALLGTALLAAAAVAQDFTTDFDAARERARAESKHLLLEFTGSDWCVWCKRLRADVLEQPVFHTPVEKGYVLVELDYPHDLSLQTDARRARNAELRGRYRPEGFPTIVLTDAEGVPYAKFTGYGSGDPQAWFEQITAARATREQGRRALAAAREASGPERAAKLREFVATLPPGVAEAFHGDVVAEIDALEAGADLSPEERAARYLADRRAGRYQDHLAADRAAFAAVRAGMPAADREVVRRKLLIAELGEALVDLTARADREPVDPLVRERAVARALAARAALGEWPGEAAAVGNRVLIGLLAWADARRDPLTFERFAAELKALREGRFAGNEDIAAFLDRRLDALCRGDAEGEFLTAFFARPRGGGSPRPADAGRDDAENRNKR